MRKVLIAAIVALALAAAPAASAMTATATFSNGTLVRYETYADLYITVTASCSRASYTNGIIVGVNVTQGPYGAYEIEPWDWFVCDGTSQTATFTLEADAHMHPGRATATAVFVDDGYGIEATVTVTQTVKLRPSQ